MMAKACVFMFHKTHAISHLGCFQSCRLVKYMNIFEKEKKRSCSFSWSKPKPKNGKKAISCESTADLALST